MLLPRHHEHHARSLNRLPNILVGFFGYIFGSGRMQSTHRSCFLAKVVAEAISDLFGKNLHPIPLDQITLFHDR